jgi:hypothetical protein
LSKAAKLKGQPQQAKQANLPRTVHSASVV